MDDDNEPLVTITGPALAMLLYENNKILDQHGFLIGDVHLFVSKKVTDSDRDVEHRKLQINIKSIIAYPLSAPFYNGIGQVDQDILRRFLGKNVNKVVGWYHHRDKFSTQIRTMRDCVTHKHLSKFFSNELLSKDNFLFYCLTFNISNTCGTLKWKQTLYRVDGNGCKPLSFKVINLGADATRPDGTDYKPIPQKSSGTQDAFEAIYKEIRGDLQSVQPGINAVKLVQNAAEAFLLKKIVPLLHESDKKLSALEEEVFTLRNKKFEEKFMNSPWGLEYKMQKMKMESKQNSKSQDFDSDEDMFDLPEDKPFGANGSSELNMNCPDCDRSKKTDSTPPTDLDVVVSHCRGIFSFLKESDIESKIRKRDQGSGDSTNHKCDVESKIRKTNRTSDESINHSVTSQFERNNQASPRNSIADQDGFITVRKSGPRSSKSDSQNRSKRGSGDFC